METFAMLLTHIIKTIEFFLIEGIPSVPFEYWAEIPGAIAFNIVKLITIYLSIL